VVDPGFNGEHVFGKDDEPAAQETADVTKNVEELYARDEINSDPYVDIGSDSCLPLSKLEIFRTKVLANSLATFDLLSAREAR